MHNQGVEQERGWECGEEEDVFVDGGAWYTFGMGKGGMNRGVTPLRPHAVWSSSNNKPASQPASGASEGRGKDVYE